MSNIKFGFERNIASNKSFATRKKMCGIGVNDAWYVTTLNTNNSKIICPAYRSWCNMIRRCYDSKFKETHPTYIETIVCEEWLTFSNFLKWFDDNYIEEYQLDKDILGNGKLYSPNTCVFIPGWLNNFIIGNDAGRGEYPIGVGWDKKTGKLRSYCKNPFTNKQEHLGYFISSEIAHAAWMRRKIEHVLSMKSNLDKINEKIYESLIQKIKNSK